MLKLTVYNYWRDPNNYQHTCFYKIIRFSVQFSAIVNRFIVKTELNSTFTNDLKRKINRKMFIVADLVFLSAISEYIQHMRFRYLLHRRVADSCEPEQMRRLARALLLVYTKY